MQIVCEYVCAYARYRERKRKVKVVEKAPSKKRNWKSPKTIPKS